MIRNFSLGVSGFFEAFGFIQKHNLQRYFIFPFIAAVGILILFIFMKDLMVEVIMQWIYAIIETGENEQFAYALSKAAVNVFAWILVLYLYILWGKYLMLIILSPVISLLSEKTETILTGKVYRFSFFVLIKEIFRGVLIAVRNFIVEKLLVIPLFILGILVHDVSPVFGFMIFLISAYFYGFSVIDAISVRHGLSYGKGVKLVRKNRSMAMSIGTFGLLISFVPIIGPAIAILMCTVGATLAVHKKYDLGSDGIVTLSPYRPNQPEIKVSATAS